MAVSSRRRSKKGERARALTLVLDQASGSLRLTDDDPPRVVGVSLLPDAAALIAEAESAGTPVHLLVPGEGDRGLDGLVKELLPVEAIGWLPEPEGLAPPSVVGEVFVCADAVYREAASAVGYRPLPHPVMAREGSDPSDWLLAAFIGERELFQRIRVVPFDLERRPDGRWRMLGRSSPPRLGAPRRSACRSSDSTSTSASTRHSSSRSTPRSLRVGRSPCPLARCRSCTRRTARSHEDRRAADPRRAWSRSGTAPRPGSPPASRASGRG